MLGIDSGRYLGNLDENTMHTLKWWSPVIGAVLILILFGTISAIKIQGEFDYPSRKTLQLR